MEKRRVIQGEGRGSGQAEGCGENEEPLLHKIDISQRPAESNGVPAIHARQLTGSRRTTRYLPDMATDLQEISAEELKSRVGELRRFL